MSKVNFDKMNIVSEYVFTIQSMGYRPVMERVAYYLLPVIPLVFFLITVVLGCKGLNGGIKKVFRVLGVLTITFFGILLLKIRLPGHREDYRGWEGMKFWKIVPSQESAIVILISLFLALLMALLGYRIGIGIRKILHKR